MGTHKVLTEGDNEGHHSPRSYLPKILLYSSLMWWRIQAPPEGNSQPPMSRKRKKDQNPQTWTRTKGKFLGNRSQNKYRFHWESFIPSYLQSLATSYICLAHFTQTMLNSIMKNEQWDFYSDVIILCAHKPHIPSFPTEWSSKNPFRHFQAPLTHLQKSVVPKSNICSPNQSPPVGLMSPWLPKDEEGWSGLLPQHLQHVSNSQYEPAAKKIQFTSRFPYNSVKQQPDENGSRKLLFIMTHF